MDLSEQNLRNVLARLINQGGAAEGTNLPPAQVGEVRVPIVSSLKLGPVNQLVGATQFILLWNEPENIAPNAISCFRVYTTQITSTGTAQTAPVTTHRSPATVNMQVAANTAIVFTVQTVMANGLVSDPLNSPSVSYYATTPTDITGPSFTLHSGGYTVSMNATEPTGGIATRPGVNVKDDTNLSSSTMASGFVTCLNGNQQSTAIIGTNNETIPGSAGVIRCFDGTGAGGIGSGQIFRVDGNNSVVSMYGGYIDFQNYTAFAPVGFAIAGYIKILINGVAYGLAYYN